MLLNQFKLHSFPSTFIESTLANSTNQAYLFSSLSFCVFRRNLTTVSQLTLVPEVTAPHWLNAVFYSGGATSKNHRLHRHLVRLARAKNPRGKLKLLYLPFCEEGSAPYYARIRRRYRSFGVTSFDQLILDKTFHSAASRRNEISKIHQFDIIYLAGGNTFYFLHWLRKTKALSEIKRFAKAGGVIAGLSAGALIVSPNINLAAYPAFDADENAVGMKDLRALGLVDFEFYPHYSARSKKQTQALLAYSRTSKLPILACDDGDGIVIEKSKIQAVGRLATFCGGQRFCT